VKTTEKDFVFSHIFLLFYNNSLTFYIVCLFLFFQAELKRFRKQQKIYVKQLDDLLQFGDLAVKTEVWYHIIENVYLGQTFYNERWKLHFVKSMFIMQNRFGVIRSPVKNMKKLKYLLYHNCSGRDVAVCILRVQRWKWYCINKNNHIFFFFLGFQDLLWFFHVFPETAA